MSGSWEILGRYHQRENGHVIINFDLAPIYSRVIQKIWFRLSWDDVSRDYAQLELRISNLSGQAAKIQSIIDQVSGTRNIKNKNLYVHDYNQEDFELRIEFHSLQDINKIIFLLNQLDKAFPLEYLNEVIPFIQTSYTLFFQKNLRAIKEYIQPYSLLGVLANYVMIAPEKAASTPRDMLSSQNWFRLESDKVHHANEYRESRKKILDAIYVYTTIALRKGINPNRLLVPNVLIPGLHYVLMHEKRPAPLQAFIEKLAAYQFDFMKRSCAATGGQTLFEEAIDNKKPQVITIIMNWKNPPRRLLPVQHLKMTTDIGGNVTTEWNRGGAGVNFTTVFSETNNLYSHELAACFELYRLTYRVKPDSECKESLADIFRHDFEGPRSFSEKILRRKPEGVKFTERIFIDGILAGLNHYELFGSIGQYQNNILLHHYHGMLDPRFCKTGIMTTTLIYRFAYALRALCPYDRITIFSSTITEFIPKLTANCRKWPQYQPAYFADYLQDILQLIFQSDAHLDQTGLACSIDDNEVEVISDNRKSKPAATFDPVHTLHQEFKSHGSAVPEVMVTSNPNLDVIAKEAREIHVDFKHVFLFFAKQIQPTITRTFDTKLVVDPSNESLEKSRRMNEFNEAPPPAKLGSL